MPRLRLRAASPHCYQRPPIDDVDRYTTLNMRRRKRNILHVLRTRVIMSCQSLILQTWDIGAFGRLQLIHPASHNDLTKTLHPSWRNRARDLGHLPRRSYLACPLSDASQDGVTLKTTPFTLRRSSTNDTTSSRHQATLFCPSLCCPWLRLPRDDSSPQGVWRTALVSDAYTPSEHGWHTLQPEANVNLPFSFNCCTFWLTPWPA
jgi:hypothetical protein